MKRLIRVKRGNKLDHWMLWFIAINCFSTLCTLQLHSIFKQRNDIDLRIVDHPIENKRKGKERNDNPTVLQTPHVQKVDTSISSIDESTRKRYNVHIVVSHCDKNISWIWKDLLKDYDAPKETEYVLKTASILTKCNVAIPESDLPQNQNLMGAPLIQVISLPNVGRCDHSYSYWIKEVLTGTKGSDNNHHNTMGSSSDASKLLYSNRELDNKNPLQEIAKEIKQTDVILFVKDHDNNSYRAGAIYEGLLDMLDGLTVTPVPTTYESWKRAPFPRPISWGMVCKEYPISRRPASYYTNMAHRGILWTFQMGAEYVRLERDKSNDGMSFYSPYRPMRNWITHLLPEPNNNKAQIETLFSADYFEEVIKDMIGRDDKESRETLDLVPLCYGGIFSTYWGQLASFDSPMTLEGWNAITASLSRANNLEEGHFMERWWGDLLSWSSFAMIASNSSASDGSQLANPERGISLPKVEQALLIRDERKKGLGRYYEIIQLWKKKVW